MTRDEAWSGVAERTPKFGEAEIMLDRQIRFVLEYLRTDDGNALRFVEMFGDLVRYVRPWDLWFTWDGRRWCADDRLRVQELARKTIRRLYALVPELKARGAFDGDDPHTPKAETIAKFALHSQSKGRLDAMLNVARSDPRIVATPGDLDSDPWVLNVGNGTIDLRLGELRAHRREDMLTKLAPFPYDPEARAPRWERFLLEVFDGDTELVAWFQRLIGYGIVGSVEEQVLPIFYGGGANGKSTLLKTLAYVLGDYCRHTPATTFIVHRGEQVRNDLAMLRGTRLVVAIETAEERVLDEALVKSITGGERVTARFLYQEFFEYEPEFLVLLATNHQPVIRGLDWAIWRRLQLVPFERTFPKNRALGGELCAEASGILAWAVHGVAEWRRETLGTCAAVERATREYRTEQDPIGDWLEERCEVGVASQERPEDLHRDYLMWAAMRGRRALGDRGFGKALTRHGIASRVKVDNIYVRPGVRLRRGETL